MFPRLGLGLGLRPAYYRDAIDGEPRVAFWELISENFLVAGGNPRRVLRAVRERRPIVLHGVALSIGSADPLDDDYLARLAALVREVEPAMVSDHLCWSGIAGRVAHDLWPLPYTEEVLAHVVARVGAVQDRLGRRILLENPSSYAAFVAGELAEAEFLAEVARRADCGILLDVNNLHVSATNHGWDPGAYLAALPAERVGHLHLAGHTRRGAHLIDSHDRPICDATWELYELALARFGDVATSIERDADLPPLAELVGELDRASAAHRAAAPAAAAASRLPRSAPLAHAPAPRELAGLQRRFHAAATASAPAAELVTGAIEIYADMYASRLRDALAADYPKLRAALGADRFDALVARYVHACPPTSFTVRDAGLALPGFLRAAADAPPWAAELAALERARLEVFDAADDAPLERDDVTALAPEAFAALGVRWVTASTVVRARWTVDAAWSALDGTAPPFGGAAGRAPVPAVEDGADAAPPSVAAAQRVVLVWRRDLAVVHRTLDADEGAVAGSLAAGTTVAALAAQLADAARVAELLVRWIDARAVAPIAYAP